ncbi:nadh dehydrogenase subunit 2 [Ceraceosorus bombacis]|uniref:NADH-ubiquinone oxidoreductase chain 2 n=1 Tax=Ceraceosorus bombacis TaxID=401625 RepID=A0A0P1A4H8_9BASI|nr:nadh dehydrogenase subunit 2 [Ceraceosorus bombacis]
MIDNSINVWKNVLLISSLLSLVIGTVLGLSQYRIKRLLAFSTISHVGFILLALSVNTIESIEAFLFYIITYSITNLNAFLILLAFGYIIKAHNTRSKDIQFIHELKGQFNYNNVLSLSLALCLFSIAGVPPLVGFFAKQIVLYSSTHAGYYFISLVAILVSVISASYYLKIIKVLYFDTPEEGTDSPVVNITTLHSTIIAILSLAMTFFVLQPTTLLNSCQLLCLSLYYY